MTMPTNQAMWLPAKGARLQLAAAPMPIAGPGQIVVRAAAIAINPVDWIVQRMGGLGFPWLRYPMVLGWDVVGEVTAIGEDVTQIAVGDRVVGLAVGQDKAVNDSAEGGFQHYVRLRESMTAPIPPTLSWEQAAVLPLGIATAACALFQKQHLALAHPSAPPSPIGKTVLIWGASTSVGSNAVQLAVAAGYEVIATASPRNHAFVQQLGAEAVYDYRSPTVVRDLVEAMNGRELAGAVAIGAGSALPCVAVAGGCAGDKAVAMVSPPVSFDQAPLSKGRTTYLLRTMPRVVVGMLATILRARGRGVRTGFVNGVTLLHDEVGPMIFNEFLPAALTSGRLRPAPNPQIAGHGLSAIPDALDRQRRGVSNGKIVVTL
ncbi:NADPH:quinone reductase-like Zn-dependent oxidoreductase [Stakelama sediminis]|uniref:NADPH:quinone reductase-like Zn-dependent oxidoreductase n=2 Tax=Stakelama sediminis TaxID=463200 RepID=A0A840Z1J5_9SPHN|nr:NADPH:quinone reductase-like Zn-dependent oxidoreductase [Stakelama sediminis]